MVWGGVAFELLCERELELPQLASHPHDGPLSAQVLCSISAGLASDSGAAEPCCDWHGDSATLRGRGAVASLRQLAPRRYAVAAHIAPHGFGVETLLELVSRAVRRREGV